MFSDIFETFMNGVAIVALSTVVIEFSWIMWLFWPQFLLLVGSIIGVLIFCYVVGFMAKVIYQAFTFK